MLQLVDIKKTYDLAENSVQALRGVNVEFGDREFVAILGQSGCGKTTLLNIIGGLDQYTSGDLIINGVSTKTYKSSDWDQYRNRSIGFVFQSYQLVPHQSVLANVELTMTLSGISKAERRKKAIDALTKVGLGDQIHKKPNQMSGGQMQRAAIARALVNDPDIILADEPTGALDTETSVQIMDILKEVARDHLVIMVTHNPELAEKYATRIVRLSDGMVVSNSENTVSGTSPVVELIQNKEEEPSGEKTGRAKKEQKKKQNMSFFTALSLSFNNLLTKKGRTFLTSFAGAIGIIGIALILAASTGVQNYIDKVESDTLGTYPLQIVRETVNMSEMMESMMSREAGDEDKDAPITAIRSNDLMTNFIISLANERTENDMAAFKHFVETDEELKEYLRTAEYSYSTTLNVFNTNANCESGLVKANPSNVMSSMGADSTGSGSSMMANGYDVFSPLPGKQEMRESMYEVIDGRMPENYDEVVIAVSQRGRIADYTLYALGLFDQAELKSLLSDVMAGKEAEKKETAEFSFEELKDLSLYALANPDFFEKQEDGTWKDRSSDADYMKELLPKAGIPLKVVGVVRSNTEGGGSVSATGGVLYLPSLTETLVNRVNDSEIVRLQKENEDTDVFTGIKFEQDEEQEGPKTMEELQAYIATLPEEEQQTAGAMIMAMKQQGMTDEQVLERFAEYSVKTTDATCRGNLSILGVADLEDPSEVRLYPVDFEAKEKVVEILNRYSDSLGEGGELKYTDYVGILMSSVTTIINAITYVLVGFVSVSLIVSSIMIGIITYISVLERTREIGILRSIGASKKDISRVFNAETLIIGFVAGIIGVVIPYGISTIVNVIMYRAFDIENIMYLSPAAAAALVIISMLLTLIGGLIPSRIAANKDPVEALRTE